MAIIAITTAALLMPALLFSLITLLRHSDNGDYEDENNNHIYYDRKLILWLEKEYQNH